MNTGPGLHVFQCGGWRGLLQAGSGGGGHAEAEQGSTDRHNQRGGSRR